jgi:hypothetical protein
MTCMSGIAKHINNGARPATVASWTLPATPQAATQWPTPATSDQPLDG